MLINDIERVTGRRLIVYYCNPDVRPSINQQDAEGFKEILDDIPQGGEYDLLIESPGGDTDAADTIVSMLQSKGSFRAIVPGAAKSNATLVCLAAEELIMGPYSEIGPIDPRIGPENVPATFWAQKKFAEHPDQFVQVKHLAATDAQKHTESIAKNLLTEGMMKGREVNEIMNTVHLLCAYDGENLGTELKRQFYSHGATINAHKAKDLHLNVVDMGFGGELFKSLTEKEVE